MPPEIVLLHWKSGEIHELASRIVGFTVRTYVPKAGEGLKGLKQFGSSQALVIALDRLPSHGRDVGYMFHQQKANREVPLIYAGGDPAKVAAIRELVPDAVYTSWDRVSEAIREAIEKPVSAPHKPGPVISKAPLAQKIGLQAGMRIALLGAPALLEELVPGLPADIAIHEAPSAETAMTLWFVRSAEELHEGLPEIAPALGKKPRLWIFYKRGKGLGWTGMLETAARHGLSQFKILRLDGVWSGLAFGRTRGSA